MFTGPDQQTATILHGVEEAFLPYLTRKSELQTSSKRVYRLPKQSVVPVSVYFQLKALVEPRLINLLRKHGVTRQIRWTVTCIKAFQEEARLCTTLTAPARFKEVNANQCKKELTAMKQQARKLMGLIDGMSHTAATELFYSARWQRQINLRKELSDLIDSILKINIIENNQLNGKGRPRNEIAKRFVDFLLRIWELDNKKKAVHNTWPNAKNTFQDFVDDVFKYLSVQVSVERLVKDAINSKDKT